MTNRIKELSPEQLEIFAAGLYHLANVDGVSAPEQAQLTAFLHGAGADTVLERLPFLRFDPEEAAMILKSEWMRHAFFRAALDIIRADGVVNQIERDAMRWLLSYLPCSISSVEELEENTSSDF